MKKNFFLTGEIRVGKSTLINGVLEAFYGKVCGFITLRAYHEKILNGFYMESVQKNLSFKQNAFIGKCIDGKHWVSIPSTFDDYGVEILNDSLNQKPDLIIMDELGFFEAKAFDFQSAINDVLDSDIPVLGVIKKTKTPFLEQIRNRNDVEIYTVTRENQYEIFNKLCEILNVNPEFCKEYIKLIGINKEGKNHLL